MDYSGFKIDDVQFHKLYRSTYVRNKDGDEGDSAPMSVEANTALEDFIKENMIFDGEIIKLK